MWWCPGRVSWPCRGRVPRSTPASRSAARCARRSGRGATPSGQPGGFVGYGGDVNDWRDPPPGIDPPTDGGFRLPDLGLEPATGLTLATWLATSTFGVLLFALVFSGRGLTVILPGELSVLIM